MGTVIESSLVFVTKQGDFLFNFGGPGKGSNNANQQNEEQYPTNDQPPLQISMHRFPNHAVLPNIQEIAFSCSTFYSLIPIL